VIFMSMIRGPRKSTARSQILRRNSGGRLVNLKTFEFPGNTGRGDKLSIVVVVLEYLLFSYKFDAELMKN
jgi:hypothetical protein